MWSHMWNSLAPMCSAVRAEQLPSAQSMSTIARSLEEGSDSDHQHHRQIIPVDDNDDDDNNNEGEEEKEEELQQSVEPMNGDENGAFVADDDNAEVGEEQRYTTFHAVPSRKQFNFALDDVGAKVLSSNAEAMGASRVLNENRDKYLLNPSTAKRKWITIELSEEIVMHSLTIANFEHYSCSVKHFQLLGSTQYPCKTSGKRNDNGRSNGVYVDGKERMVSSRDRRGDCMWEVLGTFRANNTRKMEQSFMLPRPSVVRYLKMLMLSHYNEEEFYCTLTLIRVHGSTLLEDLKAEFMGGSIADIRLPEMASVDPLPLKTEIQDSKAASPSDTTATTTTTTITTPAVRAPQKDAEHASVSPKSKFSHDQSLRSLFEMVDNVPTEDFTRFIEKTSYSSAHRIEFALENMEDMGGIVDSDSRWLKYLFEADDLSLTSRRQQNGDGDPNHFVDDSHGDDDKNVANVELPGPMDTHFNGETLSTEGINKAIESILVQKPRSATICELRPLDDKSHQLLRALAHLPISQPQIPDTVSSNVASMTKERQQHQHKKSQYGKHSIIANEMDKFDFNLNNVSTSDPRTLDRLIQLWRKQKQQEESQLYNGNSRENILKLLLLKSK